MPFLIVLILAVISAINFYFAKRFSGAFPIFTKRIGFILYSVLFSVMTVFLLLSFLHFLVPLPKEIKAVISEIGSYYMGVLVYLLLFLLLIDLLIILLSAFKMADRKSGPVRFASALMAVILTVGVTLYASYNAKDIKRVSYDVNIQASDGFDKLSVVLITDLHLGSAGSEERLSDLANEINDINADLVCISGDIFNNDFSAIADPEGAARILGSIKSRYGVYACLGNHDTGDSFNEMEELLRASSITLLKEAYVEIDRKFTLVGRLDSAPIGKIPEKRKDTAELLSKINPDLPVIVMDHNPKNIDQYPDFVDLILCGHTHKGQIFPGNLITGLMYTADYGYYRANENSPAVIISSGVGTWGPPMRLGTDSEIVTVNVYAN